MNKSVLKKLFSEKEQSVELSEIPVELSIADDVKKYATLFAKYKSEIAGYIQEAQKIDDSVNKIKEWQKEVDSIFEKAVDIKMTFVAKVKELGLDPFQNKDYKSLTDAQNDFKSERRNLDKVFFKYSK